MRVLTGLILTLSAALAWGGEIYTWKDASGKVHYSDTPPPGVAGRKLRGSASSAGDPSAATRNVAEQNMEFRKRQQELEKARAKAEAEKRESEESRSNCAQAKSQLRALESGQRMSRLNEAGENIPLDDEMRAQEIARAKKAVQSWCK